MGWKETKISDLEVTESLVSHLAKLNFFTLADLAAEWDRDQFRQFKNDFGAGGSKLLQEELRRVSAGESGKLPEPPAAAPVPAAVPQPELAAVAGGGNPGPVAPQLPEGQIAVSAAEWERLSAKAARMDTVAGKNDEVMRLRDDYHLKKDASLQAKKTLDTANAELNNLIADEKAGQRRLALAGDNADRPLDDRLPESGSESGDPPPATTGNKRGRKPAKHPPVTQAGPEFSGPDGWRGVSIDVLTSVEECKPNLIARLQKAGIKTLGALQEMRASKQWPPRFGDQDRDHIIEITDNWLTKNRDSKVFAQAAAVTETRETETPKLIVIVKAIEDRGAVAHDVGKVLDVVKFGGDKGAPLEIGCMVNGVGLKLTAEEWAPAPATIKRPKRVQLLNNIAGADTEERGLVLGMELSVVRCVGPNVWVKAKDGTDVLVTAAEFDAIESFDVPVSAGMVLTPGDLL